MKTKKGGQNVNPARKESNTQKTPERWPMNNEKTIIILIRHGETTANRDGIFRGRKDFPLNENGILQAQQLAEHIAKKFSLDAIYSGPLSRTTETAAPVAEKFNIPLQIEPRLNNISLGSWEGVPYSEIERKYPEQYHLWLTEPEKLRIPDGETLADVRIRSVESVDESVRKHTGQTIALVSHRAVIKPLIAGLIGLPAPYFWKIHIDNAAYCIIYHNLERGFEIYQSNINSYLGQFVVEEGG